MFDLSQKAEKRYKKILHGLHINKQWQWETEALFSSPAQLLRELAVWGFVEKKGTTR